MGGLVLKEGEGWVSFNKDGCSRGPNSLGIDLSLLENKRKGQVLKIVEDLGWTYIRQVSGNLIFKKI